MRLTEFFNVSMLFSNSFWVKIAGVELLHNVLPDPFAVFLCLHDPFCSQMFYNKTLRPFKELSDSRWNKLHLHSFKQSFALDIITVIKNK